MPNHPCPITRAQSPVHAIAERWIGKCERRRLQALAELKRGLESVTRKPLAGRKSLLETGRARAIPQATKRAKGDAFALGER